MKKLQPQNPHNPSFLKHYISKPHNKTSQDFINSYMKCHLLYHMKKQPQIKIEIDQSSLISHVFLNYNEVEDVGMDEKSGFKTLFNTMNKQDNSHSKEEEEYSKYLKQYQTMVKGSRKRQYTSPQQTNKEMNLLIHQFLSDMESPSTEHNQTKVEKTATPTKSHQQKVKVQKINLNTFSISKVVKNEEGKGKVGKQKKSKEKTPRFININDMKAKKPQKISKEKQKLQIQVIKVKNITPTQVKIPSSQTIKRYQTTQSPIMLQTFNPTIQKQLHQDGYSSSYLKNKQIKDTHYSNKNPQQSEKQVKNEKKPLKIQIELPVQQLSQIQQPQHKEQQNQSDLDKQRQKIIKQISHKVLNLLHKTNRITNKSQ